MPTQSPLSSELRDLYGSESSKFQQKFSATKDGLCFLRQRSALVESILLRLWEQFVSPEKGAASTHVLIALGDFGRRSLFPYSEI
jgi:[protein-PII] uridylyltransferase